MAEVLKIFQEGEDILASETNANNNYLLGKISDNASTLQNYVEGEVTSIQSSLASAQATLQNNINELSNRITQIIQNLPNAISPDVANRYTINNGFIAPSAGWIFIRNLEESTCVLKIDGVEYNYAHDWGDGGSENSLNWYVGKGQKVEWSGRISFVYFTPAKLNLLDEV